MSWALEAMAMVHGEDAAVQAREAHERRAHAAKRVGAGPTASTADGSTALVRHGSADERQRR
jgi:hypothetical protein